MKVIALLTVSVALLQSASFSAEASPYEASFPNEDVAEAYPMDSPDQDNRVLAESDFEADNSVDEIIGEQTPNWEPQTQDKVKLERLLEKWTDKPAMVSNLVQHPPAYGSGTHHATFASGHHAPTTYTSGHHKPAPFSSGASHAHDHDHDHDEILSIISFELSMAIDEKTFNAKKSQLESAMAHELGLPVGEVRAMFENLEVDADLDDVLVEEQSSSSKVKFQASHKSKDSAAAKTRQAKIEANAKKVASGGKSLDGIKVPQQGPIQMKVEQKNIKKSLKKSGVSSISMPSFSALVVVGLTAILY